MGLHFFVLFLESLYCIDIVLNCFKQLRIECSMKIPSYSCSFMYWNKRSKVHLSMTVHEFLCRIGTCFCFCFCLASDGVGMWILDLIYLTAW